MRTVFNGGSTIRRRRMKNGNESPKVLALFYGRQHDLENVADVLNSITGSQSFTALVEAASSMNEDSDYSPMKLSTRSFQTLLESADPNIFDETEHVFDYDSDDDKDGIGSGFEIQRQLQRWDEELSGDKSEDELVNDAFMQAIGGSVRLASGSVKRTR